MNELGIINDTENLYYLPAFSKANINDSSFDYERSFAYKKGNLDFKTWSNLVYKTFGINGAIGINYTIASLFRDIIFNDLKFFPFLFLFGQYGTGKTSYIESVLHLFGTNTIGTSLSNVTTSGLSRETSQRINGLFYFKEFTSENSDIANPFILNAYDGAGRTHGAKTTDNKTIKHEPKSGSIFDGNYLPIQKDAVFSRLIVLMFEENRFTKTQKQNFKELANQVKNGLTQIVKELLKHREHFKNNFKKTYEKHISEIDNMQDYKDVPSRLKNHTALITSVYEVLHKFLDFPYSFENLAQSIIKYMIEQTDMLDEIKDISNFWRAAEYYSNKNYINLNTDYLKETSFVANEGFIFIKYDVFYTHYVKYCRENQLNKVDKISLKQLLTSKTNKSFIPSPQKSRKSKAIIKFGFGSCYQFSFKIINDAIKIDKLELNL